MKKRVITIRTHTDNSFGVAALVFAVFSIIFYSFNGIILSILGIIFALKQWYLGVNRWVDWALILSVIGLIVGLATVLNTIY